ncbi:MAG: L,D-transpeptidase [Acidimicrobiales bacterium]|nr:L,D-transpeptidase [Acidimicrobiales bacterium]
MPKGRFAIKLLATGLAISLMGACAGDRPTMGTLDPSVPSSTISGTPTTLTPVVDDGILTPDELLGWIATPTGEPAVYSGPSTDFQRVEIAAETDMGAPTTFAVVGEAGNAAPRPHPGWYQVALPTRPNGSTGWVQSSTVTVAKTPFRIFVELGGRTLRVEKDKVGVFTAEIAVGTEENPTPVNGTFVTELIDNNKPDGAYGPYAFGLAMHSDTLTEFAGGNGQVGIHGTNRPDLIGQAVSHGCVRLANDDIEELVRLGLPLGVPVFISQ